MTEQGVFYNAKVDRVYRARETHNVLYTDSENPFVLPSSSPSTVTCRT